MILQLVKIHLYSRFHASSVYISKVFSYKIIYDCTFHLRDTHFNFPSIMETKSKVSPSLADSLQSLKEFPDYQKSFVLNKGKICILLLRCYLLSFHIHTFCNLQIILVNLHNGKNVISHTNVLRTTKINKKR